VRTLSRSRNLLPHQVHDCLTASSLLSQLELIYVVSAKLHKQNRKIERIYAKLGFGSDPISVKSITDLPVKADKALIEADVALQYVDAGAKQSFKSGTIELDTLEGSLGSHCGSSGPFVEQGDLTKVVRGAELPNLGLKVRFGHVGENKLFHLFRLLSLINR